MAVIQERASTHVYKVRKMDKEEMDSLLSLCIYEEPAYCVAACPLKLDTKSMLSALASGDFKRALQIYEKIAPFPMILSSACEAPCEDKCRLGEIGDGIAIRDLEQAAVKYGVSAKRGGVFRMRKKKSVAIFGSGLFCLLLAGEIEKKAYPVTVFCDEGNIEAFLRSAAGFLPDYAFEAELARLKGMDIEFRFSAGLSAGFISAEMRNYDVSCGSQYAASMLYPGREVDDTAMIVSGEDFVCGPAEGVLPAAFAAKKAALSVDRLAQGLSPFNSRGEEGQRETKLYTDLSVAEALVRVPAPEGGYTESGAIAEASRCIQCSCDECFKSCAFIKHYKKHPGLLGREIFNNTQIIMGDHQLNKPMNSCSLCGQCTVVCPNGFDMARVCHMARENMVSTDKMPLAPHEFALLDMHFSNTEAFLSKPQPGYEKCKYVFFPGCQASAIAPSAVRAAYEDLCVRLDGGVALMLGCCGAICDWAGRYEMYDETKAFIAEQLEDLGNPGIIVACPSCKKKLSSYTGTEICGIWDVLREIGMPDIERNVSGRFAMHDSCGARGDADTQEAVRSLAAMIGCELIDTPFSRDRSPCCGYGGLTMYTNRDLAHEMAVKCLERSELPYISYCMACRDRFAREGRESLHILELAYGIDSGSPPDISEKRYNRLSLKQGLLSELWGEKIEEEKLDYSIVYTAEALALMDDRMILKSDVAEVIRSCRETGESVLDRETGLLTARHRLGNVTFWVVYSVKDNEYTIHRAYSHRMIIVGGNG